MSKKKGEFVEPDPGRVSLWMRRETVGNEFDGRMRTLLTEIWFSTL